jgi:hypothetical protein
MSNQGDLSNGRKSAVVLATNTKAQQQLPGEYRPYPGGPRTIAAKEPPRQDILERDRIRY